MITLTLFQLALAALIFSVVAMLGGYSLGRESVEPRMRIERAHLWRTWRAAAEGAAKRFRLHGKPVRASLVEDAIAGTLASRGKRPQLPSVLFAPSFGLA